jgi:hypothetical protein
LDAPLLLEMEKIYLFYYHKNAQTRHVRSFSLQSPGKANSHVTCIELEQNAYYLEVYKANSLTSENIMGKKYGNRWMENPSRALPVF